MSRQPRPPGQSASPLPTRCRRPPTATAAKSKTYGAKDAFSAGIAGYDDATCAGLLDDYNNAVNADGAALGSGDNAAADRYGALADRIYGQLTDNCAVIN